MHKQQAEVEILTGILLDKDAAIADRDDAAMYLGAFDDDRALNALIRVGTDETEHDIILWSCGTSIADIWLKRGSYNRIVLDSLTQRARQEVYIDPGSLREES